MKDTYLQSLLGENEHIILVTHQHWFKLLQAILVEIVLFILTVILVTVLLITTAIPLAALGFVLLLIPIVSALYDYLNWYNHKYIVTNRRVIQILGIVNKNVTDSSLEKVNDLKMQQSFWGRMFNFGDIEILTASELGINRFTFIGDPIRFKAAMINAKAHLENGNISSPKQAETSIPELITKLDELRRKGILSEEEFQQKKTELLKMV